MIRWIWMATLLNLILGVCFMGIKILNRPVTIKSVSNETVGNIAKAPSKATNESLPEKIETIQHSEKSPLLPGDDRKTSDTKQMQETLMEQADSMPGRRDSQKSPVSIDPIDEEDRALTAGIMGNVTDRSESFQEPVTTVAKENVLPVVAFAESTEELEPPMDLNRLSRVREIYAKAIDVLDF